MARRTRRTRRDSTSSRSARLALVSAVLVVGGLAYLMVGMALLLQPEWYFENLGAFPPYNRLVLGQFGSVLLPLGVVLVIASQNPSSNRMVIGAGSAAAMLLALNQLYSVSSGEEVLSGGTSALVFLGVFAAAIGWAFWQVRPRFRR